MISVRITCEKDSGTMAPAAFACPYVDLEVDPNRTLDFQIARQLGPLGWSFNGPDQQFCPRHNPAFVGLPLVLTGDYIEPLPGVRLRLMKRAIGGDGAEVHAELLLDRDRYDIEQPSPGVWRAKPAGTSWEDR